MGLDGMDGNGSSLGGVSYRAPYGGVAITKSLKILALPRLT